MIPQLFIVYQTLNKATYVKLNASHQRLIRFLSNLFAFINCAYRLRAFSMTFIFWDKPEEKEVPTSLEYKT